MKKLLHSLIWAALPIAAAAQLPNGTIAPNFVATDIYGVQHDLHSYLDAGKPVFLDISATWCGPCWNYHKTHALDDFYFAFGPGGSNEAVVIFVEGDGTTTNNDLMGLTAASQGDWVTGTYLPIIDNGSIATTMGITYFPTVYRICPDKTMYESGALGLAALRNSINTGCGSALQGTPNQVRLRTTDQRFCGPVGNITYTFKNLSNAVVTNAVINLKRNGNIIATSNYSGNLAVFAQTNMTFNNVDLTDGSDNLTIEVENVNGNEPFNELISNVDVNVTVSGYTGQQIQVEVHLDNYADEASWAILNSVNQVIAQGGPYTAADNNSTKTINVTLPEAPACYRVRLSDAYGDGWGYGNTPHGITIKHNNNIVYQQLVGNFGGQLLVQNAFHTNAALGQDEFTVGKAGLFPNPSTGIFYLTNAFDTNITVTDITGKTVWTGQKLTDQATVDLSHLSKGIYMAQLEAQNGVEIVKIVIK